jgi:hypothetical protein
MAELKHHETLEEAVRHLESRFDELTSEYDSGDLMWHLRGLVAEILREGDYPREVVLASLDDYRHVLRDSGRDEYEDDVQDVLDLMTGFGPSRLRI